MFDRPWPSRSLLRRGDGWEALLAALRRESPITVERNVDHIRTLPSYAELDVDAIRVFVRRSHDVVLDGVEQRRQPRAPEDSAVFDIRLISHRSFGFHSAGPLIALV